MAIIIISFPSKIPRYSRFYLSKGSSSGPFFFQVLAPFLHHEEKKAVRDDDHALTEKCDATLHTSPLVPPQEKVKVVSHVWCRSQRGHAFSEIINTSKSLSSRTRLCQGVISFEPSQRNYRALTSRKNWHATNACLLDGGYYDSSICSPHYFIKHSIDHAAFVLCTSYVLYNVGNHTHVITSRAWGTLDLGILLALILGLIARIPQSDIVLIAAVRCIGIRSSSTRAARLLLLRVLILVLVVIKRLLILLLGLREGWAVAVLVLVI